MSVEFLIALIIIVIWKTTKMGTEEWKVNILLKNKNCTKLLTLEALHIFNQNIIGILSRDHASWIVPDNFFKRNDDQKKLGPQHFCLKAEKKLQLDPVFITKSKHKILYLRVDLRKIHAVNIKTGCFKKRLI